jgi:hypothetical protein
MTSLAVLVFSCVAAVSVAEAPGKVRLETLAPGDVVRVQAAEGWGNVLEGRFEAVEDGRLRVSGTPSVVVVPLDRVRRLDVRRVVGKHTKRGALLGLLPFALVGVAAIASSGGADESGVTSAGALAVLGVGVGGGALIGSKVERVEWRNVSLAPASDISAASIDAVADRYVGATRFANPSEEAHLTTRVED